jgi:hypothetical protein
MSRTSCDICARICRYTQATQVITYGGERIKVCDEHADNPAPPLPKASGPYNGSVGSKGGGASKDVAELWNGKAGALRKRVYEYLQNNPPAGAEDIAKDLNEDPDNVSPRCSELVTWGKIEKGPRSATTSRGSRAHVYRFKP